MPSTVNGIGTWYYGRRNVERYTGTCRSCNNVTTLTSYDTRLFFVILFVPVIPLGRKRVIEECAACSRHGVLSFGDWGRARRRADEAVAAYRAAPADPELAQEALGACASYRNLPALLDLAPDIEHNLGHHPKTLALLGVVYDSFGRPGDNERVLRRALESDAASLNGAGEGDGGNDEDEAVRQDISEMLAAALLRQGKPDAAEPYVQHIVEQGIPDRIDALYQLAQGYQIQGNHDKALEYFAHCEAINPAILQDETFVRLRDASAAQRGTAKPVRPDAIVRSAKSKATRRRLAKVVPAVLVLAAAAYLTVAWAQGRSQRVHLVNGLARPYTVQLNDTRYSVAAESKLDVTLPQGDVRVEIVEFTGAAGPATPLPPPETVTVRTPLLTRPFASPAIVINPDRSAVVLHRRGFYAPGTPPPPVDKYHAGQLLYQFDDIDYPFQAFPPSLQMKRSSGSVERRGVSLVSSREAGMPAAYVLMSLREQVGDADVARAARQHVLLDGPNPDYFAVLRLAMPPAEVADFLRPHLGARPAKVEWHRAYQEAMEAAGREKDVEREYRELLAKEPADSELTYLASRVERDVDVATALCERAAAANPPSAYALYSLAWNDMGNGEFARAVERGRQAVTLRPSDRGMTWLLDRALLAACQHAELLARLKATGSPDAASPLLALAAATDEAYALQQMGNKDEADAVVERIRAQLVQAKFPGADERAGRIRADLAYAAGDPAPYVAALSTSSAAPAERVAANLTAGSLDEAEREAAQIGDAADALQTHLLLYLAADRARRPDLADRHLGAAVKLLQSRGSAERAFAAALEGKPLMPTDRLLRQRVEPSEKVVLLAAVGRRDPSAREACHALARRLNYDKRFPHLLLRAVLEESLTAAR